MQLQQNALICHLLSVWYTGSIASNSKQVLPGQDVMQPWCSKSFQGKLSCNHSAASKKGTEKKNKLHFGLIVGKPKYQVIWSSLSMTHHHTETCNAHTGGGTNAQTGIVGSSAVQRNVSSDKGKISSALSHKTAPKSSIPAATDCVRKGPAAATRSGAATLRQSAIGKSALTNSC